MNRMTRQERFTEFFDKTWQNFRKPLKSAEKRMVRLYDDFLLEKGFFDDPSLRKKDTELGEIKLPKYPPNPDQNFIFRSPKNIAVIHEDVGHLTGGRYYAYFVISALLELGHNVTVYTNRKAVFSDDFSSYKKPEFKIASQTRSGLEELDIEADVYIGSPISGAYAAARLGKEKNKPAFAMIFDPFPMMEKYKGSATYPGWERLLKQLRTSDVKIITLCNETTRWTCPWLLKKPEDVFPLYPCINSKVLYEKPRNYKRQDYVLFISRLVGHKRFEDVVKACKKVGVPLKVISSANGINAQSIVSSLGAEGLVEFHLKVDDTTKFDMIKRSKAIINGSIFEGFGMFVSEAIACGVPFVGYDYPTFTEQVEYAGVNNVYLAKPKDVNDLASKLKQALSEGKFTDGSDKFDFERMVERLKNIC